MATPYSVVRLQEAGSTQDLARARFHGEPVLVVAERQTAGRGRSGATWENAPRALAASLAIDVPDDARRAVLSLLAGVAAKRVLGTDLALKWPNDLMVGEDKAGGILVEVSDSQAVVGLGLNLWWPDAPDGIGALFGADPGPGEGGRIAELWAGQLVELIYAERWPRDEYLSACTTVGRRLTWEPSGSGRAVDVAADGSLVVETDEGVTMLRSGAVQHVRG